MLDHQKPASNGRDPASKNVPLNKWAKRPATDDLREGLSSSKGALTAGAKQGAEGAIQSGSYALEVLSCTYGTRVHCLGNVVKDDKVFPWFYDADGMAYTTEFISLVADFEKFAMMVIAFARCTPEQLGFMPSSIMNPPGRAAYNAHPPMNLGGYSVEVLNTKTNKPVRVVLEEHAFSAYVIQGRRTFVYSVRAPKMTKNKLIIKFSY